MNTITIVGNLGKDPEQRYTPSGRKLTTFSVASNHEWTDGNGEKQKSTSWFNVEVWNGVGEACFKYLKKGRRVLVQGRCEVRNYEKDGVQRTYVAVVANQVEFLDPAPEQPASAEEGPLPF